MAEAYPDSKFNCLICMKPYNNPRELPCCHSFCCQCLTSYIEAEHVTADEDRHYFPCPVCDMPISPRDVSLDVRKWAISFPVNSLFLSSTAHRSNDRVCEACLRDNETSPGEVWCTDCVELLCKQCRTVHGRIKLTTKHRLIPVGENVDEFRAIMVEGFCPNHDGKPLDIYCLDHSAVCCSVCVALSHRNCNHVQSLREVVEKTMTDDRSSHETEWDDITEETKTMLEENDAGLTLLNSQEKEVSVKMTDRIQQAKDKLDSLNTTFQSELAGKFNLHRKQLSTRRGHLNTFHTNAVNSNMLMTRVEEQCSDRELFIVREKTKNQILSHYRRMDKNTKYHPNRFDFTLKLEAVIDEIMKLTTVGNIDLTPAVSSISLNANVRTQTLLGTLFSTPSASKCADSTSVSDISGSLQHIAIRSTPNIVDVWIASVSCVRSITLERRSKTPWLVGGIFVDDNKLLMADYNNSRLLLFDDKYSYMGEQNIDGSPTDIAHGHFAGDVFVAVDEQYILKGTLRDSELIMLTKIESVRDTCSWGIAVIGENVLVGTAYCVNVFDKDWKICKSIRTRGGITDLAVSADMMYYTDNHDVVCRRLNSDAVVYRFSDAGLKDPSCIALDRDDNLYICGRGSSNVHIVSPDGSRRRLLLPTLADIAIPWGIIVHPTKQEFVVTSYMESTSLEIYRFSDI